MTVLVSALLLLSATTESTQRGPSASLVGFRQSSWLAEQVHEEWIDEGVRVLAIAPGDFDPKRPTRLVFFATPNGNSIEQSLGCSSVPGLDWHFDIQHAAAQVRKFRALTPSENVVLACTEADGLSWPAWKRKYKDGPARVRKTVEAIRSWIPGEQVHITLACHSGGGSFLFGYLDSHVQIPSDVDRFIFLDANYSYSDADKHGDKLIAWLRGDPSRKLVVLAYDDRKVTLNGKPVVGPDSGTFRATERMRARFAMDIPLAESKTGDFVNWIGLGGQVAFHVHTNPANKILHTVLVGELNGLLYGLEAGGPKSPEKLLQGPRSYTDWIQPAPSIPARPAHAVGGAEFFRSLARLTPDQREEAMAAEISRGNIPNFLRSFQKLTVRAHDAAGKEHSATIEVMPDYLVVGSDDDFVRVPITPMTAARVADVFGCALPTRKIVDEVYRSAAIKLEPRPLTKDRESVQTFVEHNSIIESQRAGRQLGLLVAGIKKDVVVTNRLGERANRVAIYGWHKLDGSPIQPLTIVHVNWYVDYSHGVRLVKRTVLVDGKPRDIRHVLYSPDLVGLLSDEGQIRHPTY
jgi:hypothetical protein